MNTMELIERLKSLSGPSAAVDEDICEFLHEEEMAKNGSAIVQFPRPNYTGSFDAARKLIPLGCYWHAAEGRNSPTEPLGGVQIINPSVMEPIAEAEHETVEIALCIAALEARVRVGSKLT